jgi:putative SOS response-associated peptidase YedK
MCSTYEGRQTHKDIDRMLRSNFHDIAAGDHRLSYHVGDAAPVVLFGKGGFSASEMHFKLVPNWSETQNIKFATHNARLLGQDKSGSERRVYEAPSYRRAYKSGRILVPMDSFIEPSYWGELQGNMLRFSRKSEEPLFCAAIYDEWIDRAGGEIYRGFSLLVHTPYEAVFRGGHHRSPFFISPETFKEWTQIEDSQLSFEFLITHREVPDLVSTLQRPLAEGWQRRKAMQIKKARLEGLYVPDNL